MDTRRESHATLPLFSQPRARSANPETSKAAAASVKQITASHKRVLAMFTAYGDMTDETLAIYLDDAAANTGSPLMSPSGIRSRRSELAKPNMDRLDQIAEEERKRAKDGPLSEEIIDAAARIQLRHEGFRSPLWDTGKREEMSTGRKAIVWGIAR